MRRWQKIALVAYWLAAPAAVVGFSQIIGGLPFTLTNGTVADATQVMADFNQIVNNTNANAAKNGTNSDITALTALVTPLTPAQGGTTAYAAANTSGGSANAQTLAVTVPSTYTLTKNYLVTFVPGATNTAAMTLNVNGTGVKNVFKQSFSGPIALVGGEVVSGQLTTVAYDGTQFVLTEVPHAFGISTDIASATTTDIGTVASHTVRVTGTTTITSFGSTAQTDFPVYIVRFAGALTLTNGANLALPGGIDITTAATDTSIALYLGAGAWRVISYQRVAIPVTGAFPTVQRLAAGSGTYTPTAGTTKIRVMMQGPGGGGGATVTNNGAAGSAASSFGSWTANAGAGGAAGGAGGSNGGNGGTTGTDVSNATNTLIVRITGQRGGDGPSPAAGTVIQSGAGGSSYLGHGGAGIRGSQTGSAGVGFGGGGAGGGAAAAVNGGAGGGAGEFVEFWVNAPAATSYVVGAGGAGGAAGTNAGGAGSDGRLVIEEFYQ